MFNIWRNQAERVSQYGGECDICAVHSTGKCTAAHCTVGTVSLRLSHKTLPSSLSLPAHCHLLLGGHSSRRSSAPLTAHEPAVQHVLNVTAVWTEGQPPGKPSVRISLLNRTFIFGLTNNYCSAGMFCKAAGHNSIHLFVFQQQFL